MDDRLDVYNDIPELPSKTKLKLSLGSFNGPLDMLLSLVKEAEIEIKDIFLSDVTDQFIEFLNSLKELDVDIGSEYLDMAATLMEIKSRALLPSVEDIEQEETPEQELIRRLEEYRLLKEASERLKEHENVNRLFKAPDKSEQEVNYIAADLSLDNLLDAYVRLLSRIELRRADREEEKEILKDTFTVSDKIVYIKKRLEAKGRVSFFELFGEMPFRAEVVVTFSALLELIKLQYVKVAQMREFGDIDIVAVETKDKSID